MSFKSKKDLYKFNYLRLLIFCVGFLAIFTSLFWGSGIPLFNLARKPSLYYSLLRVVQNLTGLFINVLLLLLGYSFSKSGKTNVKLVIQQWLTVFAFGAILFMVFCFRFHIGKMNNFYDIFFPLLRNVYPLLTGIFIGQLALPFLQTILKKFDNKLIFNGLLIVATVPSIFDRDLFGFGAGNTVLFSFFLFTIGSLAAYSKARLIKSPWLGFLILISISILINALMPYITYGLRISLRTAARFTPRSSAPILLASIYFFSGLKKLFKEFHFQSASLKNVRSMMIYSIGVLMISTPSVVAKVNQVNEKLSVTTLVQKFVVTLVEGLFFSFLILVLGYFICLFFDKFNFWKKYQDKNVLQAINIVTNSTKELLTSRGFFTILVFYILSFCSMLLMNDSLMITPNTKYTMNIFTYTFFVRSQMIWVNTVLILAIFAVLRFIFAGRYWAPFSITAIFVVIASVASKIKQILRQEPILPSDMSEAKNLDSLLGMLDWKLIILALMLILGTLIFILYMEVKHAGKKLPFAKRTVYALLAVIGLSGSFFANHANMPPKLLLDALYDSRYFLNQSTGARANGPLMQFVNNIDVTVMKEPKGYTKQRMMDINRKYANISDKINQKRKNNVSDQTVVMTLSESFSDPRRVPGLDINKDPMPNIRSLKKKTTSGLMISAGYGGGTANMEYMAVTGFGLSSFSPTLSTPYTQLVDRMKVAPSAVQNFKHSSAIHPYSGVYYNRPNAYKKFGFDSFSYVGSKHKIRHQHKIDNSQYLSDQTAYNNTLDQIKREKDGQFINLVTMQNHLPYNPGTYKDRGFRVNGPTAADGSEKSQIQEYATGMSHTDDATANFIKQLDKINKPITFIFYGDHLPGIYDSVSTENYGLQLHETDYFIYSNKFARENSFGTEKITNNSTKIVSPTSFFAMAVEQSNSKVNPYLSLLTKVNHNLPAYGSGTFGNKYQLIDNDGKTVTENSLTKSEKQLLDDYRLVQYDMSAGKQYLAKSNFFNDDK